MYSRVVFVTGMNSVVPGWLGFHWLNVNRPGSVVGSGARRGSSSTRARRYSSSSHSTWASCGLPERVPISPGSGWRAEHVQHVEAVVVREEELGAVAGARARPGAGRPLHERAHPARRVEVAQVEPRQAGAGGAQERFLQLGERDGLVRAGVGEDVRLDRHAEADATALAVEDRLEEGVRERVVESRRRTAGGVRYVTGHATDPRPGRRRAQPGRRGSPVRLLRSRRRGTLAA